MRILDPEAELPVNDKNYTSQNTQSIVETDQSQSMYMKESIV